MAEFDAISALFGKDQVHFWGEVVTAAIVAGGSKASIKFFHDVMSAMSSAERERRVKNLSEVKPATAAVTPRFTS